MTSAPFPPAARPPSASFHLAPGTAEERGYIIENLALLISSGLNVLTALEIIAAGVRSSALKKALVRMLEDIGGGLSLSDALAIARLVSPAALSLIRVGEQSGRLPENLQVIVESEEKNRLFRARLKSAMLYPIIVFVVTCVVGIGIAWFVLPRLAMVFSQLQIELPWVTRLIIGLGDFLGNHGAVVVPVSVAGIIAIIYVLFGLKPTKHLGEKLLGGVPGVGKLLMQVEMARCTFILGTLLTAGLPILAAIRILTETTELLRYQKFYRYLYARVEAGSTIQDGFHSFKKSDRLVPLPIQQMLAAAEQSGKLAETLLKITRLFEEKSEITTKNLSIIIEPILLVIVWAGVAIVALAVILPIYGLIGGLNT